jgi:hypothetical protein
MSAPRYTQPTKTTRPRGSRLIETYREEIDIGRLRHGLGVSRKVLHQSVIVARRRGALCASFRYCRQCLGRGYHSLVHQFERVSHCPIHGQPLERRCRWCGCRAAYRLHARLLETPYRCAQCRAFYGTQWPGLPQRSRMPMKELIPLTRAWIEGCLY